MVIKDEKNKALNARRCIILIGLMFIIVVILTNLVYAIDFSGTTKIASSEEAEVGSWYVTGGNKTISQTFKVGDTGTNGIFIIKGISIYAKRGSGYPDICIVNITNTNSSHSPQTQITANISWNASDLTEGFVWYNITLPEIQLNRSGEYALVMGCDGIDDGAATSIEWDMGAETGYGNVQSLYNTSNAGIYLGNWTYGYHTYEINATGDMMFMVWGIQKPFFNFCEEYLNVSYVNFTFKDEISGENINGTFSSLSWDYWIGISNKNNLTFSTTSNYSNYTFCFEPPDKEVVNNLTISYKFENYPQRTFKFLGNYSNVTNHTTLYLLSSSDGIYVTFQVLNAADQPINNVYATASRQISGVWTIVGTGTTGDDGGITFWLNPDYVHIFNFTKTGYPETIVTITPTQSSYTVYLGGEEAESNVTEYTKGVSYKIYPESSSLLNNTDYTFVFNINSSYYLLNESGFLIGNQTEVFDYNYSESSTGDNITLTVNTGNNTLIIMGYYWKMNDVYYNYTRTWSVGAETEGLTGFFGHLRTYIDSGDFFGLSEFGLNIIIFLIIFIVVGLMAYSSGLTSPAAVITMIFILVAFFDVGLGLMIQPINAIPHFITVFTAILTIAAWVYNWR